MRPLFHFIYKKNVIYAKFRQPIEKAGHFIYK